MVSSAQPGLSWWRVAWVAPAALGAAVTGLLCWGAWQAGYDPGSLAHGTWGPLVRPGGDWALLVTAGLWAAALAAYWWPRRRRRLPVGLVAVAVMAGLSVVLGTASFVPCRGDLGMTGVVFWVLQLFVGQPAPVYPGTGACAGAPPPGLQVAQVVGLSATLTGALTAGAALWRPPLDRLRSLLTRDATVFTGLDTMTLPLLRRLAEAARSPHRVIVIEPDPAHPLLDEARAAGARVIVGDPASPGILAPVIAGWRGMALGCLYAMRGDDDGNEAVLATARRLTERYQGAPGPQPRLVRRIDDVLHASYWRAARTEPGALALEETLSVQESTACALAGRLTTSAPRVVVLCGAGNLSLAVLLELARRSWEQADLAAAAAAAGREAGSAEADGGEAESAGAGPLPPVIKPVERVVLLHPGAADVRRDYLRVVPPAVFGKAPPVDAHPVSWQEHLLRTLDGISRGNGAPAAVIITEDIPDPDMHTVERAARLHPQAQVFIQLPPTGSSRAAAFYGLHLFTPALLIEGEVPEDMSMRIARHWHECYRLSHPAPLGHPKAAARLPWPDLDPFLRQDNLLQVRMIMSAITAQGRLWIPVHMVPPGSVIELTEREAAQAAEAEHNRWLTRRLAAGRKNEFTVPWNALPLHFKADLTAYLLLQVAQLEDFGLVPVVPVGGPPQAVTVEHTGMVSARQAVNDTPEGHPGDWTVTDNDGETATMTDREFRSSHEPAGNRQWHRVGTFRAWQVTEKTIIRTEQGRETAHPGDWVVEAADGSRRPVSDDRFRHCFQPRA
jgi:hypothetical protein